MDIKTIEYSIGALIVFIVIVFFILLVANLTTY